MICKIIPRRVLTYSFVVFLLSCVFCAFGSSSNVSATSISCSKTISSVQYNNIIRLGDSCPNFSSSTDTYYIKITSFTTDPGFSNLDSNVVFGFGQTSSQPLTSGWFHFGKSYRSFILDSNGVPLHDLIYSIPNYSPRPSYFYVNVDYASWVTSFTINFDFSTDLSDFISCPICEVCQVCPAIPDNPYDNKFDNITKAIYVCGASLLVIYFFFCIYKIVVKDGGSR